MSTCLTPRNLIVTTASLCFVLLTAGCNKKADDSLNFKNALDNYYSAHPACLWSDPVKFPIQADTSDSSKTARYDALVDQGLLVRTTAEKRSSSSPANRSTTTTSPTRAAPPGPLTSTSPVTETSATAIAPSTA